MAFAGTSHSEVIAAGGQNNVLLLNIDRGSIIKQVFILTDRIDCRKQLQNGIQNYGEGESLLPLQRMEISPLLTLASVSPHKIESKRLIQAE
jgi:hypothetical protein